MKTIALALIAVALLGCTGPSAPHRVQQVTYLTEAYTGALRTLTAARQQGLISDDKKASIEGYRKIAAAALDDLEDAATQPEIEKDVWQVALEAAVRAVERLVTQASIQKRRINEPKPSPSGPVGSRDGGLEDSGEQAEWAADERGAGRYVQETRQGGGGSCRCGRGVGELVTAD
jgi:hypothetical protein